MAAMPSTLFTIPIVSVLSDIIRQNSVDYCDNFAYTCFRTLVRYRLSWKGIKGMFKANEEKFMEIIRENDNPEQAAMIAIKVFAAFLAQLEADQVLQPVCLLESS